jgi:hypothetical protein
LYFADGVVSINSLLQSFNSNNVVSEKVSKVPYLNGMVHQKTDHLLAGCGKQDVSPHGDHFKKSMVMHDLRHDCRYHTPSRRKHSTLPTQCYASSSTQCSATSVNNEPRDDDDSSFKDDTADDDDNSFKDNTTDDEPNYEDSKFDDVPLLIDDYVGDDSNNDIFSTKRLYKMKAERDFFSSSFPSFVVTTFSRLFRHNEV